LCFSDQSFYVIFLSDEGNRRCLAVSISTLACKDKQT